MATTAFPELMAGIADLYGASSARVCEARAFVADMDALDREELALERTVQALVARKAPDPIGLKFYRMVSPQPETPAAAGGGVGPSRLRAESGEVMDDVGADDNDDDSDDMEEDEMEDEEDVGDEEEDDDDAFPLDSDGGDSGDDDPFAREDDVSMDLEEEAEEDAAAVAAAPPRRETW